MVRSSDKTRTVKGGATPSSQVVVDSRKGGKVTRIANGVPMGGELEYVDGGTLSHALTRRQPV